MNFVEQITRTRTYTEEDIAERVYQWCRGEWHPDIIQLYNYYEEDYLLFKEKILDIYDRQCKIDVYKNDVVNKTHNFTDEDFECIHKALKKYVDETIEERKEWAIRERTRIIRNFKREAGKIGCTVKIYDVNGNEVDEDKKYEHEYL